MFTAVFEEAPEDGFTAFVQELPGAISQGETLDEARENLGEAIKLVLEANRELAMRDVDEARVTLETIRVND